MVTESGQLVLSLPDHASRNIWEIDVALFAEGFTFQDNKNTAKISLSPVGDSTLALFFLTPQPINRSQEIHKIYATFWHQGKFLAKVMREITVVQKPQSAVVPPQHAPSEVMPTPVILSPALLSTIPDLTVYILHGVDSGAPDKSLVTINSPELQLNNTSFSLDPKVSTWLTTYYGAFSKAARGTVLKLDDSAAPQTTQKEQNIAKLKGFGKKVYQEYAPPAFKNAFWTLKDKLGADFDSIQIFTNDPILPWELMRPTRADGSDEQDFLGIGFRIARWHVSQSPTQLESPPPKTNMDELLVIAPRYEGNRILPNIASEIAMLRTIHGFHRLQGQFEVLKTLFATFAIKEGIIHFAGHGTVQEKETGVLEYAIQLEDTILDVMTWRGLVSGKLQTHPFIFFNACEVGQSHAFANFVDGWAPTVLESGASGYIGGLWPLADKGASEFAVYFYQQFVKELKTGSVTMAEILRRTRQQFYENGDPTFLGYVYYGDPDFQLIQTQ